MLPFLVVHFAGQRRQKSIAHVGLAHAVFVPVGIDIGNPVFAQGFAIDVLRAQLVHRAQPSQLQIQIVVGQGLARLGSEPVDIEQFALALIGRAQRSADVFADPAGENPVAQEFFGE